MTDPSAIHGDHSDHVVGARAATPASHARSVDHYNHDHDEINLAPYIRRLASGWRVIFVASLAAAFVAIAALSLIPPKYESVATLLVAQTKLDSTPTGAAPATPFRILFQNYALAAELTAQFGLDKPPFELTPHEFLRNAVKVEEIRGLNVLQVKVVLRDDAQRAAAVTNALASRAVQLARRITEAEASLVTERLREPLDEARRRLKAAEQELITRREQVQLEVRKNDATTALTQRGVLLPLESNIAAERARLARSEQELAKQSRIVEAPRQSATASALLDLANEDAAAHADKRTLSGLNLEGTTINPVYEALQYQVALSRSRLAGLESQRRLLESQGLANGALAQFKGVYSQEVQLDSLASSHQLLRKVYEEVAFQYEQARLLVTSKSAQLQVIDDAVPADRPLPRYRAQWAAVALLLGGALGSAFVLVSRRFSMPLRAGLEPSR